MLLNILKCLLLSACIILAGSLIVLICHVDAVVTGIPERLDRIEADVRTIAENGDDLIAKADDAILAYRDAGNQASGLIADVRGEIPVVKDSLAAETQVLNSKLDALNASVAEVAGLSAKIQPTIDGLNLMFRRDAVPAQTLGLLGASKVAAGEIAQTMRTVRDTVKQEAAPTALAVRRSAEGTAGETAQLEKLTGHVDDIIFDLFLRPRTFWQKARAWVRLLIGPATIVATR